MKKFSIYDTVWNEIILLKKQNKIIIMNNNYYYLKFLLRNKIDVAKNIYYHFFEYSCQNLSNFPAS
jgi:hypothetical protein